MKSKHTEYFNTDINLKWKVNSIYILNKFIEVSFKNFGINNRYSDSKCMSEQIVAEYLIYGGLL